MQKAEQLAIVLRGNLAASLQFAGCKKNPDFFSEAGALDSLLPQAWGCGGHLPIIAIC